MPRTVLLLGIISFLADICSEMTYPILPLFLVGTLKAPEILIGVIEGVAESVVSLMRGWSGVHSDKIQKRVPFIRTGYAMSAIGKTAVGLANSWVLVFVARTVDRIGKGVRSSARDALLADSVDKSILGFAFGFHRAMDTAGAFLGVLLGILILSILPGDYRIIFFLAAIPGALSIVATGFVKEGPKSADPLEKVEPARQGHWHVFRGLDVPTKWALFAASVFALANTSDAFLLLRAKELGYSDAHVLALYLLYNLVVVLFSTWTGHLSDHFGRLRVLIGGWILFSLSYFSIASVPKDFVFASFAFYGLSFAMTHGVTRAFLAEIAPTAKRAGTMGLFFMVSGLATLVGNIGFGLIWQSHGSAAALCSSASVAVGALSLLGIGHWFSQTRR